VPPGRHRLRRLQEDDGGKYERLLCSLARKAQRISKESRCDMDMLREGAKRAGVLAEETMVGYVKPSDSQSLLKE
jgi:hypothetical protein